MKELMETTTNFQPWVGAGPYGNRSQRLQLPLIIVLLAATLVFLNISAPPIATWLHCLLASAILVVGTVPSIVHLYRREIAIPFLPVWGVVYAIYFGLPIFTLDDYSLKGHGTEAGMTSSLEVALAGISLMLVTYYYLPGFFFKALPKVRIALKPKRAAVIAIWLGVLGFTCSLVFSPLDYPAFSAVYDFIAHWPLLAIAILYVLSLQGRLSKKLKLFLWIVMIPLVLIKDVGGGLLAAVMRDFLTLIFLYWGIHRRIPFKGIIVCAVLLLALMGVKNDFRQEVWYGQRADYNALQSGVFFLTLTYDQIVNDYQQTYETSVDVTTSRVAYLQTLNVIVEDTPDVVPYWEGETYQTLFTTLIPRFIWPDKPTKKLGQRFGHRYSLLDPNDTATSWNFPQLGELYANFGWAGIIIGMPLLGIIFRTIFEILGHQKAGDGGVVIAVIIFVGLLNLESDFSLVFGAVAQTTLLYILILRTVGTHERLSNMSS